MAVGRQVARPLSGAPEQDLLPRFAPRSRRAGPPGGLNPRLSCGWPHPVHEESQRGSAAPGAPAARRETSRPWPDRALHRAM